MGCPAHLVYSAIQCLRPLRSRALTPHMKMDCAPVNQLVELTGPQLALQRDYQAPVPYPMRCPDHLVYNTILYPPPPQLICPDSQTEEGCYECEALSRWMTSSPNKTAVKREGEEEDNDDDIAILYENLAPSSLSPILAPEKYPQRYKFLY